MSSGSVANFLVRQRGVDTHHTLTELPTLQSVSDHNGFDEKISETE